jgi:hypothetical protein
MTSLGMNMAGQRSMSLLGLHKLHNGTNSTCMILIGAIG